MMKRTQIRNFVKLDMFFLVYSSNFYYGSSNVGESTYCSCVNFLNFLKSIIIFSLNIAS